MSFSKISVLLPTRKRIDRLDKALTSLYGTCSNRDQVEVVFRIDHDDVETQQYLSKRGETYITGPRMQGYASLPHFMNQCAAMATGDVLLMCNDDCVFQTPGWDARLLDCANRFPDGVFNIGVHTGLNDHLFPFSIVSRKLYEVLGYINDERLVFSDIFLLDVMNTFDRAVRLPTVSICHEWGGLEAEQDLTLTEGERHQNWLVFDGTPGDANDPKKNWRIEYRQKHDRAVREAVDTLRETGLFNPDQESLPGRRDNTADIREHVRERLKRKFGSFLGTQRDLFQYDADRLATVLQRLCFTENLGKRALVTPFITPQHLAVWTEFVQNVTCIRNHSQPEFEAFHKVQNTRVYDIPAGSTHCLFKFRDETLRYQESKHDDVDLLVIEDQRYEVSIVNYFVFKTLLSPRRAAVVLVHGPQRGRTGGFNSRFVENLTAGKVDGVAHQFETWINPKTGCGFSVEMHGEARQTNHVEASWRSTLPMSGIENVQRAA